MKKFTISLLVLVIAGGLVYFASKKGENSSIQATPGATVVVSLSPSATVSPSVSPTHKPLTTPTMVDTTPKPTPGMILQETQVHYVSLESFRFMPDTLTVKKGDVVVFINQDSTAHTVVATNHAFSSGTLAHGDSWTLTTTNLAVGTYAFACSLHPSMTGQLIVVAR